MIQNIPLFWTLCQENLNKSAKGPFINYVMHLGGEGVSIDVTICHGGEGVVAKTLCSAKMYIHANPRISVNTSSVGRWCSYLKNFASSVK